MKKTTKFWTVLGLVMIFLIGSITASYANPLGKTVKSIGVKGNSIVSKEEILAAAKIKPGDKLEAENIQQDLQNIYKLGYFYDVTASFQEEKDEVTVTYEVVENPVIKQIKIEGNTKFTTSQLESLMKTVPNKILNSKTLSEDIANIEKKYHDDGYVLTKVQDVAMDLDGTLNIALREGLIEEISASGNKKTKEYVITRYFSQAMIGQPFNVNDVRQGMQRVYNTGFFEDVSMHLDPGSAPDKNKLVVDVKEGKTGTATVGGGYSSADGMSGFIQFGENNLAGKGQQLKLRWQFGGITDYSLSFFDPWVDKHQTSFGFSIYDQIRNKDRRDSDGNVLDNYDERTKGGSITVGRPTSKDTRTSLTLRTTSSEADWKSGATGNSDRFFNGDPSTGYEGYKGGTINSATVAIVRDTRDNWLEPRSGVLNEVDLELGGHGLGGDYNYTKYQVDLRKYLKAGPSNSWAFRAFGGLAQGNVPDSELFDVGGADTVRGYDDYQFEGTKALVLSTEYRIPMGNKMQGVLFVDAGNAWKEGDKASLSDLKKGYGFGIRFTTPLGPLRLDYGMSKEGNKIHFSIGQAF